MPGVYNKYKSYPPSAVFIGRPGQFGNPFVIGLDGNREQVIKKFEAYLMSHPELLEKVKRDLKGKDLLCYCWPAPCHGDILLKVANELQSN